jgi:DNA primase
VFRDLVEPFNDEPFWGSCRLSLPSDFDLKERVRCAVDIVDVIGATLELQPQGRNFVTRCPWHNDRRPSMTVNQERQTWKCWPCDIGGDVFSFVMRRDGVDFPVAIRTLAELAGIPVEEYSRGKKAEPGSPNDKETLLTAMKLVSDAYFEQLESGTSDDAKIARDYIVERGISDEMRKLFRIGFAPDSWDFAVNLLQANKFSGQVAQASGVASAKRSGNGFVDMFRGRLMFPIQDLQGRPIALGGRVIPAIAQRHGDNAGGKYINGRETMLFRKSHQLYGLDKSRDAIRREGQVLVMEGYTDVVAARQAGIEQVVAVLGTALGEQHVRILKRFAERVVLVLDGDAAGQSRADEVLELFVKADADLRVLTLPDGSDPADFLADHGVDALNDLVTKSPDALDHKLARLTAGVDVNRDTHAVTTAVDTMLKIAAKAPNELKTDQLINRLSATFDFKTERLEKRLDFLRGQAKGRVRRQPAVKVRKPVVDPNAALAESADFEDFGSPPNEARPSEATPTSLRPLTGIDRDLFESLIENPDLAAMAVEAIDPDWLESTTSRMLLSAYQDLDLAGRNLDGATLLLLIENEQLKNIVVSLQERQQNRAGKLPENAEQRYTSIMTRFRERAFAAENTRQIEMLESASMTEDDEMAVLKAMIDKQRGHHGIETNP